MRRGGWLLVGGLCACGPAVPVDTGADSADSSGSFDDGLPPLTSGTTEPLPPSTFTGIGEDSGPPPPPPIYDISGGGVTTGPPDDPCQTGVDVEPLPPAVVLVVDGSASMVTQTVDHDANRATEPTTRWFALWTALEADLLNWDFTHHLGLRMFPGPAALAVPDLLACDPDGSAVLPGPLGAGLVLATLPPPDESGLAGAAPLRSAFEEALTLLSAGDPGQQDFMLLIADGAPNCDPEQRVPGLFDEVDGWAEAAIASAAAAGTSTAVIAFDVPDEVGLGGDGEPIANPAEVLDALAVAGGLGMQAMTASDVPSLQARLTEAREAMASVRLRIPSSIRSFGWIEVEVAGVIHTEVSDCETEDGFVFVDEQWDTLHLCGEAAQALRRTQQARLWPICVFPE